MILGTYCQAEECNSIRELTLQWQNQEYTARTAFTEEKHSAAWTVNPGDLFSVRRAQGLPVLKQNSNYHKLYPPFYQ